MKETIGARCWHGAARASPGRDLLQFRDEQISFRRLDQRVSQVAAMLRRAGLARGDRVAVMLASHPDHLYLIFALARLGMVRGAHQCTT